MEAMFETAANRIAWAMGRPLTFLLCCLLVIVWAATGPVFNFSDTWQLVINTGTTIVTFLMVFLIQNSQRLLERADAERRSRQGARGPQPAAAG